MNVIGKESLYKAILKFMSILSLFGKNLKKFRKLKNISQEELALKCNLNRNFIGLIERGKRGVSLNTIEIISKILDVEIYEFFLEEERYNE